MSKRIDFLEYYFYCQRCILFPFSLAKEQHLCGNLYQLLTWETNIWKVFNIFLASFNVNLAAGNKESQHEVNSSSLWTPLGVTAQNFLIKSLLLPIFFFIFSFNILAYLSPFFSFLCICCSSFVLYIFSSRSNMDGA